MADLWRRAVVRHPVIAGTIAACVVAGVVLGLYALPPEWSVLRRLLGGAVGGAGVGLIITASRIIG